MPYEIVSCPEKLFAGLSARTSNRDPRMAESIGGLWQRLFSLPPICNRIGANFYGIYYGYENGVAGMYHVMAGVEVSASGTLPDGVSAVKVPAGRYARFQAPGGPEAAGPLWQEVWGTKLDRAFTGDYEEYAPAGETPLLSIYIALRPE